MAREAADRRPGADRVGLWSVGEARAGREGRLAHVRCREGARPRGMRRRGLASARLVGAACPERGGGVAPALPEAPTAATGVLLAEPSRAVPAGTRAAPVLDGAGRHAGGEPGVPPTPTLVHPPPHGPGPDPAGRAWERLRDRRLSRRAPAGGDEAVADAARAARDAPLAEPGRPRSPADFPRLPASVTTSWGRYELAVPEAMLAAGGRVAIAGGAGVGKSPLALTLACIAASGGRHRHVARLRAGEAPSVLPRSRRSGKSRDRARLVPRPRRGPNARGRGG